MLGFSADFETRIVRFRVIRWLAILALLWPLSAGASGDAHPLVAADSHVSATLPASAGVDAMIDCPPAMHTEHFHCHHTDHSVRAMNSASPEDRDDLVQEKNAAGSLPLPRAALFQDLPYNSRTGNQPSFILFGNFRS